MRREYYSFTKQCLFLHVINHANINQECCWSGKVPSTDWLHICFEALHCGCGCARRATPDRHWITTNKNVSLSWLGLWVSTPCQGHCKTLKATRRPQPENSKWMLSFLGLLKEMELSESLRVWALEFQMDGFLASVLKETDQSATPGIWAWKRQLDWFLARILEETEQPGSVKVWACELQTDAFPTRCRGKSGAVSEPKSPRLGSQKACFTHANPVSSVMWWRRDRFRMGASFRDVKSLALVFVMWSLCHEGSRVVRELGQSLMTWGVRKMSKNWSHCSWCDRFRSVLELWQSLVACGDPHCWRVGPRVCCIKF